MEKRVFGASTTPTGRVSKLSHVNLSFFTCFWTVSSEKFDASRFYICFWTVAVDTNIINKMINLTQFNI